MPAVTNLDIDKQTAIIEAAVSVFASQGFRGADVQAIADRASVGKGTVYRYFGDKAELFWATSYRVLDQHDRFLQQAIAIAERPLEQLRALCVAYGEFFEQHPDYLEIYVLDRAEFRGQAPEKHLQRHEQMIQRFSEILATGMNDGSIRRLDARKTVVCLGSTLYGAVVFAAYSKANQSPREASAFAGDVFLRGIRADADRRGTCR